MTESNASRGEEFVGPSPLLKDILADTAFKPGRAINPAVDSLTLGGFRQECEDLANICFLDPDGSSFSKSVYVTRSRRVLIGRDQVKTSNALVGAAIEMNAALKDISGEEQARNDRHFRMLMYAASNADHLSVTETGFGFLFAKDSALVKASALLAIGRSKNFLLFRGQETPQWSEEEFGAKLKLWMTQLKEQFRQHISPEMTKDVQEEHERRISNGLLRRVCDVYDLKYFVGDSNSDTLTKQIP